MDEPITAPAGGRRITDSDRFARLEADVRGLGNGLAAHLEQERRSEMQIAQLATQVAVLSTRVEAQQEAIRSQQATIEAQQKDMRELIGALNRTRGGWAVLVVIGTVAAGAVGAAAWVWDHWPTGN